MAPNFDSLQGVIDPQTLASLKQSYYAQAAPLQGQTTDPTSGTNLYEDASYRPSADAAGLSALDAKFDPQAIKDTYLYGSPEAAKYVKTYLQQQGFTGDPDQLAVQNRQAQGGLTGFYGTPTAGQMFGVGGGGSSGTTRTTAASPLGIATGIFGLAGVKSPFTPDQVNADFNQLNQFGAGQAAQRSAVDSSAADPEKGVLQALMMIYGGQLLGAGGAGGAGGEAAAGAGDAGYTYGAGTAAADAGAGGGVGAAETAANSAPWGVNPTNSATTGDVPVTDGSEFTPQVGTPAPVDPSGGLTLQQIAQGAGGAAATGGLSGGESGGSTMASTGEGGASQSTSGSATDYGTGGGSSSSVPSWLTNLLPAALGGSSNGAGILPSALGALGSYEQTQAYKDQAAKLDAYGAPSRARYEATYAPGFTMANDPGYTDALNAASTASLHGLSVSGNPAGSPNAWATSMSDLYNKTAYPALQDYRKTNAGTGGLASLSAAAPGAAATAIGSQPNLYNAVGSGLNDIFGTNNNSTSTTLAQLYKMINSGGSSGYTTTPLDASGGLA